MHTTLAYDHDQQLVRIIDQTLLPHQLKLVELQDIDDFCHAIASMQVRGAPLIGVTAAYGLALSCANNPHALEDNYQALLSTRPTAINLKWALQQVRAAMLTRDQESDTNAALELAHQIREQDIQCCSAIGDHGVPLIQAIYERTGKPVNILTHCNAGWLATIEWGTALAPIYKAQQAGVPVHVWVDETRPRNQGANLTAWELAQANIPHTIICDNTGGHLMQQGMVDLCIVGSDRTALNGDVCNKIGTYLKALAAFDNKVPFYAALPTSTIDWSIHNGIKEIPIEQRASDEVLVIPGVNDNGEFAQVTINTQSNAANYGFDVTPARLVSGLITEHGIVEASRQALTTLQGQING